MKRSMQLIQERAKLIEAQKQLHTKAADEKRKALNEEEATEFRSLQAKIAKLTTYIEDAKAYEENLRSLEGTSEDPEGGEGEEGKKPKGKAKRAYSIAAHIRSAMTGKLTGPELEAQEEAVAERNALGLEVNEKAIYIPASMMRAAQQTVAQDSGDYGGQLVVNQAPRLIDGFMPKLFLETLGANVWTGLTGGDVPLPVSSNYTFEWLDEGETISGQKQKFTGPKLSPKRAGALVGVSKRLLMQSSIDVEMAIMTRLQEGIRRALEGVAVDGLAANKQPVGILNIPAVLDSVNQISAGAPTYANIVELQGLIQDADSTENSLGYLLNPRLMAKLKTTTKGTDMGGAIAQNGLIDGFNSVATSLVKKIAGSPDTFPIIFGDWSQLYVGVWGGIEIIVDGNSTAAAAANSVNLIVNMNADVQVANPKAFVVNTFMTV